MFSFRYVGVLNNYFRNGMLFASRGGSLARLSRSRHGQGDRLNDVIQRFS